MPHPLPEARGLFASFGGPQRPTEARLGERLWLSDLQGLGEVLPLRDPAMDTLRCPLPVLSIVRVHTRKMRPLVQRAE